MASLGVAIVRQYQRGVVFRFGKIRNVRDPGIRFMIPLVDRMQKVTLRTVTKPIQSQQIITKDNVSIGVAAVAYYKLAEAADVIRSHPIALQPRNLQVLGEIAIEKNSTIIFPAQFLDTVRALSNFVDAEQVHLDQPRASDPPTRPRKEPDS